MADLSPQFWNDMTMRVADRLIQARENLVEKMMAAGWPPFTIPPKPDVRWEIYTMRSLDEWHFISRTKPERALDEIRDFANMARRRGEPEVAAPAARAVMSELAVEDVYRESPNIGGNGSGLGGVVGGFGGAMGSMEGA